MPKGDPEEVVDEMADRRLPARRRGHPLSAERPRIGDARSPKGPYMGFLSGELIVVEETARGSALVLVRKMVAEGADLLTLLKGEDLEEEDLEAVLEGIELLDEDLEVEVRDGGQPLYPLQMVAE